MSSQYPGVARDIERFGRRIYRLTRHRTLVAYTFLSPAILFYLVFFIVPIAFSLYISFTHWDMLTPVSQAPWIGWKNYQYILFNDDLFGLTLKNTLIFAFSTVIANTFVSLLLAVIFTHSRCKTLWRTLFWLPMVTNVAAIAALWTNILDPVYGLVNTLLHTLGFAGPNWLTDPRTAMPSVIMVIIWSGLGGTMLIFSAALEGIPDLYYEAARVDGATPLQEFRRITIPLLRPAILYTLITGFIGGLGNFVLIMVMTNGGPLNSTNVVANYMYDTAFNNMRMGRASAMAFVLFTIILAITMVQLRIFRKGGVESY